MNKIFFFLAFVLLCFACTATKVLVPTETDVARINSQFPDVSLAELSNGKVLYEQNCNRCHSYKRLAGWSETEWKEIMPEMTQKTNEKARKTIIDEKGEQQILMYILAMRNAPEPSKR